MINVNDVVPTMPTNIYRYEVVNSDGTSKTPAEYIYLKFAPGTLALTPTAVNRDLMMKMQGFIGQTTVFNANGSITETNADGDVMQTVFNANGSITEAFTSGTQVMTKTTTFLANGNIQEVIS